ncbi:hypothetical protein M378DRAFT_346897 [Amanita muscaria Koide BX008]|uniref:Uncharacterized protein n=1 Tax=Amanita muscaria (strain Koide BX008) TaxID=946122 RepID=A0A0C2WY37_AMAMK|nr:hypothetical protein M378DRAFT_346897 [Amanita muscaria Koide BX008]
MHLSAYFVFILFCSTSRVTALDDNLASHRSSAFPRHFYLRRSSSSSASRNVPPEGYYNPLSSGGSMLTQVDGTYPPGQGEPLNIIISGNSDAAVLVDQSINGGLLNYFQSIGFSGECLGQHAGTAQRADLGDGNGFFNETAEKRWNYGDPQLGTCKETVQGGDHFRYWIQSGSAGNSGAIFMATSYEFPLSMGHDIVPNGYNLGRDWLIGNITKSPIPTLNLTNSSTFSGTTSANSYTYHNNIQYVSGLLQNSSMGVNHNASVPINGLNAIDGLVAVIEVTITGQPQGSKSSAVCSIERPFYGLAFLMAITLLSLLS